MKTAIIYYSKHGTTERVTHLIGEKLTNKVDYISLKECPRPDIRTYDRIILGTAIYAGSPNRKITQFCHNNQLLLEQKVIGLFICCMNEEQEAEEMNKAFPEFLQRLSIPKAILPRRPRGWFSCRSRAWRRRWCCFAFLFSSKSRGVSVDRLSAAIGSRGRRGNIKPTSKYFRFNAC